MERERASNWCLIWLPVIYGFPGWVLVRPGHRESLDVSADYELQLWKICGINWCQTVSSVRNHQMLRWQNQLASGSFVDTARGFTEKHPWAAFVAAHLWEKRCVSMRPPVTCDAGLTGALSKLQESIDKSGWGVSAEVPIQTLQALQSPHQSHLFALISPQRLSALL